MKSYDMLIQAETGLASLTGPAEAPGRVGASVTDIAAGLNAYAAILEALVARERTGSGALIRVSLFDATAEWMAVPLIHYEHSGRAPARMGLAHPSVAPYGLFATADGKEILIAIQNEREWRRFCAEILGDAEARSRPALQRQQQTGRASRRGRRAGRRRVRPTLARRARRAAESRRNRLRQFQHGRGFLASSASAADYGRDARGRRASCPPPRPYSKRSDSPAASRRSASTRRRCAPNLRDERRLSRARRSCWRSAGRPR